MKLKIFYRSSVIWNIILFIMFSFVFLYLQDIFLKVASVRDRELFIQFAESNLWILILFGFAALTIYKIKRFGRYLISLVAIITSIVTINNLIIQFSKINLIILFFYLLIAYYLYQFYREECDEAYYKSLFTDDDLFEPMLKKINCSIIDKEGNEISTGYLTNWSEEACFLNLDKKLEKPLKSCSLKITYEETSFENEFDVVSMSKVSNGLGLKRKNNFVSDSKLGWKDFYEIMEEMGLNPELLV